MGSHRSGSTILEHLLHAHPRVVGVGELGNLALVAQNKGHPEGNQRFRDSAFWQAVARDWLAHPAVGDFASYWQLQKQFEQYLSFPRLLREQRRTSAAFQSYAHQTLALFEAIQNNGDADIIVDSSKFPARAFALSLLPRLDLQAIHLVRDGRGIAWSLKKSFIPNAGARSTKSPFSLQKGVLQNIKAGLLRYDKRAYIWLAIRLWFMSNVASNWVRKQLGPEQALLYRYEDIMASPEQALRDISIFSSLDLSRIIPDIMAGTSLQPTHAFNGNGRVLKSVHIRLEQDTEWKDHLSPTDRLIFYVCAGWLQRYFGYV
jgi:hypothetical protein